MKYLNHLERPPDPQVLQKSYQWYPPSSPSIPFYALKPMQPYHILRSKLIGSSSTILSQDTFQISKSLQNGISNPSIFSLFDCCCCTSVSSQNVKLLSEQFNVKLANDALRCLCLCYVEAIFQSRFQKHGGNDKQEYF